MKLQDLDRFNEIIIQCHDNPDADALASGFGLYLYFKSRSKKVRLVYSGQLEIQKTNLVGMVAEFQIPIEHVSTLEHKPELLLTVDCQYGEGNVSLLPAQEVAIIDHHEETSVNSELVEIRSGYGSCATLVGFMLTEAGFDFNANRDLATALCYGLYSDTNGFSEIKHPLDMDMIENLRVDEQAFEKLRNSNFSLAELEIAGRALLDYSYNSEKKYTIIKSDPCDPNILGIISDFALQVEEVDACIVYNELDYGYKLSVRSAMRDAAANDMVVYLTNGVGSGGGHRKKAGGFIMKTRFRELYGDISPEEYLKKRINAYFESYDLIDAVNDCVSKDGMECYVKKSIPVAYVKPTDFAREGRMLNIRTLEGDVGIEVGSDIYIIIGVAGEVYPIRRERFERSYRVVDSPFELELEYPPTAKDRTTGEIFHLMEHAKACINLNKSRIYAKPLERTTKIYTKWDSDNYIQGFVGDYIAIKSDDGRGAYIIRSDVFAKTYQKI